jgi:hypothetical protein
MAHGTEHPTNGHAGNGHANGHGGNGVGHEQSEANLQLVVFSAIGLAIATLFVLLIVWGAFNLLKNQEQAQAQVDQPSPLSPTAAGLPAGVPKLEDKPWLSYRDLRKHEDEVLSTYGWQDQKAGVVRIPIDRAMELTLQRGLPVAGQNQAKPAAKPGTNNAK